MELLFNELCAPVDCIDRRSSNDKMKQFAETVNAASKTGFKNVRSHLRSHEILLMDNYSIHDWLVDKDASKNHKDFLYGKFLHPFINEDDKEIEEQYITANYYYESVEDEIGRVECLGFASAHLYETLSISLSSRPVWDKVKHSIIIERGGEESTADVLNISSKESFDVKEISDYVEQTKEIVLEPTQILPEDKKVHLSGDHHGNKERDELWQKLKHCQYVIELRSTGGFGSNRFIRSVSKDGVIEAVIDRKYSVWIQTTGRNYKETQAIAEIVEEEYS